MNEENLKENLDKCIISVLTGSIAPRDMSCSKTDFLKNNELLYYVTRDSNLISKYEEMKNRTVDYFLQISNVFKKYNLKFFLMKTFRSYPYADDDMDLVLVDRSKVAEYTGALKEAGFTFKWNSSIIRESKKRFYVRKDSRGETMLPIIHVHFTVSWNGIDFLDPEKVWRRLKTVELNGVEIPVPSVEDELMIMAAHTIYENTYITGGELLHIKRLVSQAAKIDTSYMTEEAVKGNWLDSMRSYFSCVESLHRQLTGSSLLSEDVKKLCVTCGCDATSPNDGIYPRFIPSKVLLRCYASKFFKDMVSFKLGRLAREAVTFGLVIWLYRLKKMSKFAKACIC